MVVGKKNGTFTYYKNFLIIISSIYRRHCHLSDHSVLGTSF